MDFFLPSFFIALGAGEWVAPSGSIAWGYYWAPGLLAAITFALVIAAAAPSSPVTAKSAMANKTPVDLKKDEETAVAAVLTISIFFWVLVAILVTAAI
ncbi:hypothetical protein [Pedobacter antarcticus]|uniref:hypothetical protein n=1 Tax=Pedobacter antarcticus TaxID=34086 RepID=UPI000885357B|nr:hypothetical protein [Pedobacter antarcticus]SDM82729.1 hypothetical protein SAMN04488084_11512 [Pedobacter antarcticus]